MSFFNELESRIQDLHMCVTNFQETYSEAKQKHVQRESDNACKVAELESLVKRFEETVLELDRTLQGRDNKIVLLEERLSQCALVDSTNTILRQQLEECNSKISQLEEDNRSFTKVSRIIAFENENTKLKLELERCQAVIQKLSTSKNPECLNTLESQTNYEGERVVSETVTEVAVTKDDERETEAVEVSTKKINGQYFYITTDDDKLIYEKKDDGSLGECLGHCEKVNGKTKVIWK